MLGLRRTFDYVIEVTTALQASIEDLQARVAALEGAVKLPSPPNPPKPPKP